MKAIFGEKTLGLNLKTLHHKCKHMDAFKKQFLDMIPGIKLSSVKDTFQKKLNENIPKIKSYQTFLFSKTKQVISIKCLNRKK